MSSQHHIQSEDQKENIVNGNSITSKNMEEKSAAFKSDLNCLKNGGSSVKTKSQSGMAQNATIRSSSSSLTSILINVCSFVVLIIVFVLFKKNFFAPFRRGFFCDDLSIRYPVGEDTVSTSTLVGSSIFIAILIFAIGEYLFGIQGCQTIKNFPRLDTRFNCFKKCLSPETWCVKSLKFFLVYLWALLASQVMVNVLKHSIGTLRPNFFAVCNPNVTCSGSEDNKIYHTNYTCQGISSKKEASLRTSFPSGHAAFSAAAALFLVAYIQTKMRKNISVSCCGRINTASTFVVLLGPSLQFVCLVLSCWTSLLRVSDYKHHLLDVIVGYVLGGIIGIIAAYHALKWDKINKCRNCTNKNNKEGSGYSIQELVELNDECCQRNIGVRKEEDIEKVMEIEGGLNVANLNLTRQNTNMTTESELNDT